MSPKKGSPSPRGNAAKQTLTTTMSLGLPPKPTEKNPWRKMHGVKMDGEKTHGRTSYLQENTHSNLQTKPPTLSHPHSFMHPTLPGTHPPRHSPSHLHVLATHFLTHALTNMHTFPKLPPLQELTCSGQRLTCSGLT